MAETKEKDAPAPMLLTLQEKTHRPSPAVQADLDAAKAKYRDLGARQCAYYKERDRKLMQYENMRAHWKKDPVNIGEAFDADGSMQKSIVPDANPPLQREFHQQHYVIGRLELELEAARRAETGS